jgi:spermidine synthase
MNQDSNRRTIILLITFLAGFSFLVFEVSWFRVLSLALGATVKASTVVLTAYMAGLGAGAWYWGHALRKKASTLTKLRILFAGIAVTGTASLFAFSAIIPAFYHRLASAGITVNASSWLVMLFSLIILFIPSFFMGGVLPLTARLLIRKNEEISNLTGRLYASEALGSVLGGLAAGFVLVRYLGQQQTFLAAVAINLLLLTITLLIKNIPAEISEETSALKGKENKKQTNQGNDDRQLKNRKSAALTGTFLFGFAVLGLQIVWYRIFRIYMTNTSYTFSLIAAVVILGLFAGSRYYAARFRKTPEVHNMFRLLWLSAAVVFAGFLVLLRLPELVMFPLAGDENDYFMRIILLPVLSSLIVILPLTFLSGYAFPLACALYTGNHKDIGSGIGKVMLFNTLGSITGPVVAAFILIPVAGAALSVLFFAAALAGGAGFTARYRAGDKPSELAAKVSFGMAILLIIFTFIGPEQKILPPSFSRFNREIVEYAESTEGTWVVGREPGGDRTALSTYVNNSAVIGSSYDAVKVVKMVGHLPFLTGLQCRNVLVVGFGIGVTTSAIASHAEVETIDCVELVSGIRGAAHYYSGLNNNIQNDPRLRIMQGDGRQYLQSTGKKYDLISSDPTHPILGSGSLYTREYFELCKARLNPGGMVSQYLPLHKLLPDDLLGIIKTFRLVFPGATIWLGHNHAVLLGINGKADFNFINWSERIEQLPKDPYFYSNPYHLAACLILDQQSIDRYTAGQRINTDDKPLTEFFRLASFEQVNLPGNLEMLNRMRTNPGDVFSQVPDSARMQRFTEGNKLLISGLAASFRGDRPGFFTRLQQAVNVNPEDEEYPFLLRFYGSR